MLTGLATLAVTGLLVWALLMLRKHHGISGLLNALAAWMVRRAAQLRAAAIWWALLRTWAGPRYRELLAEEMEAAE